MRIPFVLVFIGLAGLGACSSYSPSLGSAPFLCGSAAPMCPDGFSCQTEMGTGRMVCVAAAGGEIPDAKMGNCADDHNLEPNDDTSHAFPFRPGVRTRFSPNRKRSQRSDERNRHCPRDLRGRESSVTHLLRPARTVGAGAHGWRPALPPDPLPHYGDAAPGTSLVWRLAVACHQRPRRIRPTREFSAIWVRGFGRRSPARKASDRRPGSSWNRRVALRRAPARSRTSPAKSQPPA